MKILVDKRSADGKFKKAKDTPQAREISEAAMEELITISVNKLLNANEIKGKLKRIKAEGKALLDLHVYGKKAATRLYDGGIEVARKYYKDHEDIYARYRNLKGANEELTFTSELLTEYLEAKWDQIPDNQDNILLPCLPLILPLFFLTTSHHLTYPIGLISIVPSYPSPYPSPHCSSMSDQTNLYKLLTVLDSRVFAVCLLCSHPFGWDESRLCILLQ